VVISILDADQRKAQELWHYGDTPGEGEARKLNTDDALKRSPTDRREQSNGKRHISEMVDRARLPF
jgi:hypothetical protein